MSRSLRKVKTIVFEDYVTLNSSADSDVLQILSNDGYLDSVNLDGCGTIELPVYYIKELISSQEYKIPEDVKENFLNDIKGLSEDDNVLYNLF